MVELPVAGAALGVQGGAVLPLGQHLAADVVDARHVLALEPPEEVPQAGAPVRQCWPSSSMTWPMYATPR